jgi:hypothetical protein
MRDAKHGHAVVVPTAPPAPRTIVVELQGIGANSASMHPAAHHSRSGRPVIAEPKSVCLN